jgi:ParB family chromosome partitioning protein
MGTLHRQLQYINPQDIAFDKDNPRGLTEDQIVNDPNFKKLKSSIEEYGILEPVIIKKDESNEATYVLIDGERRLRAALAADQKEVPSVVRPTLLYIWRPLSKSVPRVLSTQTPADFGYDCRYSS